MLEITCSPDIRQDVKQCLLDNMRPIGVREEYISETPEGIAIAGRSTLYSCLSAELLDYSNEDIDPQEMLERVKEQFPDIGIEGSLQFGDDNSRQFWWFGSSPGETTVQSDYAAGCEESWNWQNEGKGIPHFACAYVYEHYDDYGASYWIIKDKEGVRKAAEILKQAKEYADRENDGIIDSDLLYDFAEMHDDPDYDLESFDIGNAELSDFAEDEFNEFLEYFFKTMKIAGVE